MDSKALNIEISKKASPTITSSLVSALLEWLLIFMLLIDAGFSYFLTKFANYCQLQIPCLLCSRLDHVLGNKRAGFYWDLICQKHKIKISSLIICQLHNNLIDVHETCESCLFSFATTNKSNAETYRLLVGKLGDEEPYYGLSQGDSSSTRKCSCCNEEWSSKSCTRKIFRLTAVNSEQEMEFDTSLPGISKDNSDEVPEISEISPQLDHMRNDNADPLPHIEYKKINVTSDTESEAPLSDNESASALIREIETPEKDSEPSVFTLSEYLDSEKLINAVSPTGFSLLESEDATTNPICDVEFEVPLRHGLDELNWQQARWNNDASIPSEAIPCTEKLPASDVNGTHCGESNETFVADTSGMEKEVSINNEESSKLEKEVSVNHEEAYKLDIDSRDTSKIHQEVSIGSGETSKVGGDSISGHETLMDSKSSKIASTSQMAESLDLGDAYRLAVGTRSKQLSGRFLERQKSMTDSTRASEDLIVLLSQISAVRGTELSLNDISPRLSANTEDFKNMEASASIGIQMLQKRISLERNESNLSLDGSTISEIEGESAVDRLKRQVEHDKKIMSALYKELEEERNASSIAASQAMAMITRLQEEKAAVQMEALQCLRMLEEQAEYDSEALQNANEMLAEKEKKIQDFEMKLEMYKDQTENVSLSSTNIEIRPDELNLQKSEENYRESNKLDIIDNVGASKVLLEKDIKTGSISLLQFNGEKRYLLKFVKKMQKRWYMEEKFSPGTINDDSEADDRIDESTSEEHGCMGFNQEKERDDKFIYFLHINGDAELDALEQELFAMKNRWESLEPEKKWSEGFEFIQEAAFCLQEFIQSR